MNSKAEEIEGLPINREFYTVLDCRIYKHSKKRIVALCVLESRYGTELKFYEWIWKGENKGWKVGLANLSVRDINLEAVAKDARELANAYAIKLDWNCSE